MPVADNRQHLPPRALFALCNQLREQGAADAAPAHAGLDINRLFKRVAIGGAGTVKRRVAVADDGAAPQRHQPGQPVVTHGFDALAHFIDGRGNIFKGGASVQHVPDVQRRDGVRVIGQGFADL